MQSRFGYVMVLLEHLYFFKYIAWGILTFLDQFGTVLTK